MFYVSKEKIERKFYGIKNGNTILLFILGCNFTVIVAKLKINKFD